MQKPPGMIQYYKKDKERGSGGEWILIERLDKILAGTGRWSRREAGELVRAGRVEVAGAVARRRRKSMSGRGWTCAWTESRSAGSDMSI